MMDGYDVTHEDILAILRPSDPKIDPLVDLLARLALGAQIEPARDESKQVAQPQIYDEQSPKETVGYWLTPVKSDEKATADEVVQTLLEREHVYAFGDRTPGRKHIKPGDWICFYATTKGVVAHAQIASAPEFKPHRSVRQPDKYPWTFRLTDIHLYLDQPTVISAEIRAHLDAFDGRDPNTAYWAWFVQATHRLSAHDFNLITRQK
jgi:hypothetical protein